MAESTRIHVELDPKGYRKVLFTITVMRMRYILPLSAFFACGAIGGGRESAGIMILAAITGLIVFMWGYIEWQVHSPAASHVYIPVEYELTEEGLEYDYEAERGVVEWETLTRWRVSAQHFVLHAKGARFLALPLTAMDAETRNAYEQAFRTHIKKGPRGPVDTRVNGI